MISSTAIATDFANFYRIYCLHHADYNHLLNAEMAPINIYLKFSKTFERNVNATYLLDESKYMILMT